MSYSKTKLNLLLTLILAGFFFLFDQPMRVILESLTVGESSEGDSSLQNTREIEPRPKREKNDEGLQTDGTYSLLTRGDFGEKEWLHQLDENSYLALKSILSERRRPFFKRVNLDAEIVEGIYQKKKLATHRQTRKEIKTWKEGYYSVISTYNILRDISDPRLIFEDEEYFLYAHEDSPDFSWGFAIEKKTGLASRWYDRTY